MLACGPVPATRDRATDAIADSEGVQDTMNEYPV